MSEALIMDAALKNLVEEKLLRWSQPGVLRWVTAQEKMEDLQLPPQVEARRRVMRSGMASYRVPRQYRNATIIAKTWPEDHLSAVRVAKLLCVTAGWATIELGKYELDLPTGTFLFIPPGLPQPDGTQGHLCKQHESRQCDVCWMSLYGEHLHLWQCHSSLTEHYNMGWSNVFFLNRRLWQYFDLLQGEVLRQKNESPLITGHLLTLLLLEAQREIQNDGILRLAHRENELPRREKQHDPIEMAMQYLDMNFESSVTIESLARQVGMSRSQLARLFRERTGSTVVEYLTQKRLEQACKLLRETEWTMTYITGFIGFRSPAHFHTLFRRQTGLSPAEYRQRNSRSRDDTE